MDVMEWVGKIENFIKIKRLKSKLQEEEILWLIFSFPYFANNFLKKI